MFSAAIAPFVQAIAPLNLTDLVVEEPDLEESVLRLYSAPASSPAASAAPAARR